MAREAAEKTKGAKPDGLHMMVNKNVKRGLATVDSALPAGSPERAAAVIATAAVGSLVLAAKYGVGPTALAVAAGYLAYCAVSGRKQDQRAGLALINSILRGRV